MALLGFCFGTLGLAIGAAIGPGALAGTAAIAVPACSPSHCATWRM
jgi:hypothetical protein